MGANTWRIQGSVYAITTGGTTRTAYLAKQTQIAAYIASFGGWYYPTGFDQVHDGSVTATQAHDELVALATALQPYTANLAGFDILNENPGWTITNNAILPDIKAALPGVPFTTSCSESFMITNPANLAALDPYVDFFDQHLYSGQYKPTTMFDDVLASTAKPVFIGEFGKDSPGLTAPAAMDYYMSIAAIVNRVSPSGRGVAGCLQWDAQDSAQGAEHYGLYLVDGVTERTVFTTPFRALPSTG